MITQTLAGAAVTFTALFLFMQCAIYADKGKGWTDRPWYVSFVMFGVALAQLYRAYAFFYLHQKFNATAIWPVFAIFLWQFVAITDASVKSYREHERTIIDHLLPLAKAWRIPVPLYTSKDISTK